VQTQSARCSANMKMRAAISRVMTGMETETIKYLNRTEHRYRTSYRYGDDSDLFTVLRRKNHRCQKESETATWLSKYKAQRTQ
jgi:hypothetical protein